MGEKLKYRVFLFLKIHSFQNPPQKHFGFDPCPNTDQRRARAPTQVSHPTSISQIFLLKNYDCLTAKLRRCAGALDDIFTVGTHMVN